jgi:excisionase family DNA binding protein
LPIGYVFAVINVLTVTEVAGKLGVTRSRVLALIRDGRIPVERIGSQYVIKPADLAAVRVRKPGRPKKK